MTSATVRTLYNSVSSQWKKPHKEESLKACFENRKWQRRGGALQETVAETSGNNKQVNVPPPTVGVRNKKRNQTENKNTTGNKTTKTIQYNIII